MALLGIDFGLTRIGIAYSDGELAQPLTTVVAKTKKERLEKMLTLLQTYPVDTIVIGMTTGTLKPQLKKFIAELRTQFPGTIIPVEESFSSKEALTDLIAIGSSKKKRRENLDAYAATLILERYLQDEQQS